MKSDMAFDVRASRRRYGSYQVKQAPVQLCVTDLPYRDTDSFTCCICSGGSPHTPTRLFGAIPQNLLAVGCPGLPPQAWSFQHEVCDLFPLVSHVAGN